MVRTRIAPSPTGEDLHIGSVYTALLNYAVAKKNNGSFIIRIEDTDQRRKVEGAEETMLSSLAWFGLNSDKKPARQSERLELYQKYAKTLIEKGHAYVCVCTQERLGTLRKKNQQDKKPPKYDGYCRDKANCQTPTVKSVVRLRVPVDGHTVFKDVIRGEIRFQNKLIDDQVLIKSDGYPTYHLAVVVDDHLMGITHVIRGEEWISSAPKHVLLYQFLGWDLPIYAHHPLFRNPDHSKLSKRRNPVWVSWYRKQGFMPEALLNYLALMGWSMPDEREIFTLEEFIEEFSLERVQTSAPVFDVEKLKWMNGEYIRNYQLSTFNSQLVKYLSEFVAPIIKRRLSDNDKKVIEASLPLIQTRIRTFSEFWPMCKFFFYAPDEYSREVNKEWLARVVGELQLLSKWDPVSLYNKGSTIAKELEVSKSKLFMDIRIAIAGDKIGPPLFESMELLGKRECISRLRKVVESI